MKSAKSLYNRMEFEWEKMCQAQGYGESLTGWRGGRYPSVGTVPLIETEEYRKARKEYTESFR